MWSTVYNRYTRRDNDILNDFIQPLKDRNLIGPNNYITIVNGISADSFFYDFFFVLMNPAINSADDLYQKMKTYNNKKSRFQPEVLDQIKSEKPEFFDLMLWQSVFFTKKGPLEHNLRGSNERRE